MVVRSAAAPPTPWSSNLAQPTIHETAYVHSFSNIIGDVRVGSNVLVAPGTSIRADEGSPFYIGSGTNIQDGVVIHGLEQGRVIGDDQNQYSVWIGNNASITHKALIHGPAYIGDKCFIGFRSTVFNARVGQGCIVMMHVLIQDVEIPPGKYVPSGSIITSQQQADRLPDVQPNDLKFSTHVVGINEALRSGYQCAEDLACITPLRNEIGGSATASASQNYQTGRLTSDTLGQVRQLLAQGYRIGTEHVDERRFRTNSWKSCAPIQANNEPEVVAALEACMSEHRDEYVRLIGIEPKGKKRVLEAIIQRPGEQVSSGGTAPARAAQASAPSTYSSAASSRLSSEVQQQVQQLISQGHRIGTEYANARQYQANAWRSGTSIQANRAADAIAALEAFVAEHEGEYVRLIGIEPKGKKRVLEAIIQRPGSQNSAGTAAPAASQSTPTSQFTTSPTNGSGSYGASGSSRLSAEVQQQVQQLLSQGNRIVTEYANARQYQANAWRSGTSIQGNRAADAIAALEAFVAEHPGEYVRLIGVEPKSKRRTLELVIQRA